MDAHSSFSLVVNTQDSWIILQSQKSYRNPSNAHLIEPPSREEDSKAYKMAYHCLATSSHS